MNDQDDDRSLQASKLAEVLNTNQRWVYRRVTTLGLEPELRLYNGQETQFWPIGTLTLLRKERAKLEAQRELPEIMTAKEIAELLGRSYGWTCKMIRRLQLRPSRHETRRSRRTALYSKRVFLRVQAVLEEAELAEFELNLYQIVELTGFDRQWIERRLEEGGFKAELKRSPLTGKALRFYPKEVVKYLQGLELYPVACTWLTAEAIEKEIGKSTNWVRARLKKPEIHTQAQLRLDTQLVPRLHFPPTVLEQFRAEIYELEKVPLAGDWLLVNAIADQLGRSKLWVRNRIVFLEIRGEMRRDGRGRSKEHFSPDIVERLQNDAPNNLRLHSNWRKK